MIFSSKLYAGIAITPDGFSAARIKTERKKKGYVLLNEELAEIPGLISLKSAYPELMASDELCNELKLLASKKSFECSGFSIALPDACCRNFIMNFENLPDAEKEQKTFITWQLEKLYKIQAEQFKISFQPFADVRIKTKSYKRVIVSAVYNDFLNILCETVKKAGIKPLCMGVYPFSLYNLYTETPVLNGKFELFLCISQNTASVFIAENTEPVYYRTISFDVLETLYSDVYDTVVYFFDDIENIYGKFPNYRDKWIERVVFFDTDGRTEEIRQDLEGIFQGCTAYPLEPDNSADSVLAASAAYQCGR